MNNPSPMYLSVNSLAKRFDLSQVTIRRRIDEMRNEPLYGKSAVLDDGAVRVYLPAFVHYLQNRRLLHQKNLRKTVTYDPKEIIRQMALDEWGATSVPTEPDKEKIKELLREIIREGIGA